MVRRKSLPDGVRRRVALKRLAGAVRAILERHVHVDRARRPVARGGHRAVDRRVRAVGREGRQLVGRLAALPEQAGDGQAEGPLVARL